MHRVISLAVVSIVAGAIAAEAGVVITQEVTHDDPSGGSKTSTHTTMIQGDRMKSVTPEGMTIVDLAANKMWVVNDREKSATEMPLAGFGPFLGAAFMGDFKTTGNKKTIAGYSCEEYTHKFQNMGSDVDSTTCVSKDAPGAAEAAAFYRKMAEKIGGQPPGPSVPQGIALADEAKVQLRPMAMQGLPPDVAKKMNDAMAKQGPHKSKTVVTNIKAEKLASEAFTVPAGYAVRKVDRSQMGHMPHAGADLPPQAVPPPR